MLQIPLDLPSVACSHFWRLHFSLLQRTHGGIAILIEADYCDITREQERRARGIDTQGVKQGLPGSAVLDIVGL